MLASCLRSQGCSFPCALDTAGAPTSSREERDFECPTYFAPHPTISQSLHGLVLWFLTVIEFHPPTGYRSWSRHGQSVEPRSEICGKLAEPKLTVDDSAGEDVVRFGTHQLSPRVDIWLRSRSSQRRIKSCPRVPLNTSLHLSFWMGLFSGASTS